MKRVLAIVLGLCLLSGLSVNADIDTIEGSTIAEGGGGDINCTGANPSDCTFRETFDGSTDCGDGTETCDNEWTDVGPGNFDDETVTLQGTYNYFSSNATDQIYSPNQASVAEYYWTAIIYIDQDSIDRQDFFKINDSSSNNLCNFDISGSTLRLEQAGGTEQTFSTSISEDTVYYFRLRAKAGSGANAECEGTFSTNSDFSGGETELSNDGTWTNNPVQVHFYNAAAYQLIISVDDVRAFTSSPSY
jgi:hypothetical protein